MQEHQPYDAQVKKRLDLVRKQFKRDTAEQKTQQTAARRREWLDRLLLNKQGLVRWAIYVFLIVLVLSVIGVTIAEVLKR